MIEKEYVEKAYSALSQEQRLKLALYNDFGEDAQQLFDWLNHKSDNQLIVDANPILRSDGVYYLYEDGSDELFDFVKQNKPQKVVKRIGVIMGDRSIAINLEDLPEQSLTNTQDYGNYDGYINNYDDAVADWDGKLNTEHIKQVGTGIELKDDEWIPSVAEWYLIYLNKRSINAAIELSGGSRIKDGWYWSSTEYSAAYAWHLSLHDGDLTYWHTKVSDSLYVRAVAAFH